MSGFLFNVNANEATALDIIMKNPQLYRSLTNEDIADDNISNEGISNIDDVSYTIYGESIISLEAYIRNFLLLEVQVRESTHYEPQGLSTKN